MAPTHFRPPYLPRPSPSFSFLSLPRLSPPPCPRETAPGAALDHAAIWPQVGKSRASPRGGDLSLTQYSLIHPVCQQPASSQPAASQPAASHSNPRSPTRSRRGPKVPTPRAPLGPGWGGYTPPATAHAACFVPNLAPTQFGPPPGAPRGLLGDPAWALGQLPQGQNRRFAASQQQPAAGKWYPRSPTRSRRGSKVPTPRVPLGPT